jgi:pyridoxine 5-phosphate synthase
MQVNGGHGLTTENVGAIAAVPQMVELNIGHFLVSRAVITGIEQATREMLEACLRARNA